MVLFIFTRKSDILVHGKPDTLAPLIYQLSSQALGGLERCGIGEQRQRLRTGCLGRGKGDVFMNHSFQGSAQGPSWIVEFQVGKGELTLTLLWHYLMEILPRVSDDGCMSSALGLPRTGTWTTGKHVPFHQWSEWTVTMHPKQVQHLCLWCFDHWPQLGPPSQQRIHRTLSPLPQVLSTPCWTHTVC